MNRRQYYEEHTLKVGEVIARLGLTPNQLTLLSLLPALVSAYFYSERRELFGALFLIFTMAFDVFDGSVARVLNKKSDFGAVLDASIDRYCEFIILLGIMIGGLAKGWIVFFCFSGMIMASYVRARIESRGVTAMSVGLMERLQKMTLILVGSLFVFVYGDSLNVALFLVGFLSHITSVQRLLYARRELP
ncbi:MAG: CDP-alcohol phosphatidyltransferase family protein [Theionarchaea archaeon]|nr:CDP-alcohol phosphatidyltransferase family protein [Theionarchaea archaeon]